MSETNNITEFRSKFRVDEFEVYSNGSWTLSVRPNQPTLGACVISLNRHALHLSDVTSSEMAELAEIISKFEGAIKSSFNHNIMNYLMLMMVDHHVHYHAVPRYGGERRFSGLVWVDNGWPALPAMGDDQHKDQDGTLTAIQRTLISALKV
jgi:diadenosine tetraphosphate (Ap4A) HIT family hydrolase